MSKQPTALRLLIEDLELNHEYCPKDVILQAATALRRLHTLLVEARDALAKVAAIENQMYGPDWEEIDEAREIAVKALAALEGEKQ